MNDAASNLPEFSVSDLSGALKRTIEDAFGFVRVRGEISGYRGPHSSGHVYFALKDQNAKIDAVIWKGSFNKLRFRPEEGLEVVATGRITTFPGKSSYQIIIEQMEPAGVGALMALLEERRRVLTAEGLFANERKRRLPYLPEVIGIVTSPTGAVIRDMIHRLSDRFPRRVILWPVRVQGEGSAEEVAAAIRGLNASGFSLPRPDVLIIARGGGSLEDLWSFNEETVVRAAAESRIPLISAIGHETDWTLLDLVADVRAPTPTAAAEMVVPVRAELLASLADRQARLTGGVLRLAERKRHEFQGLARALPSGEALIGASRQRLDLVCVKLAAGLPKGIATRRLQLSTITRRLSSQAPAARLAMMRERLVQTEKRLITGFSVAVMLARRDMLRKREAFTALFVRLRPALTARREKLGARLATAGGMLGALGYEQVLARGYAVVFDAERRPLTRAAMLVAGQDVIVKFADGARLVTAKESDTPPERPTSRAVAKSPRAPRGSTDQGTLF